jgi:predicted nucleic acid-binding Zn ribbon protein
MSPLYVFECWTCFTTEERLQTGFEPVKPRCDGCGAWMVLTLTATSVHFKGKGWAKKDRTKKEGKQ